MDGEASAGGGVAVGEAVTKIDRWAELDAAIVARYGSTGRGRVGDLTILPTREYRLLEARAANGLFLRRLHDRSAWLAQLTWCAGRKLRRKPAEWPWEYDKSLDDVPF